MDEMFDPQMLRKLSSAKRRELLRELVDLERASAPEVGTSWKWDALLVFLVGSCAVLAAWIAYLAITLPHRFNAHSWRGAWVGFDVALLATFAATGWAAWRRRQLLIISLFVLATLLTCDAWFDVLLDYHTPAFVTSLASAVVVELPLAVLAVVMGRRMLRLAISQIMRYEGLPEPVPPLWQIPLLGPADGSSLHRLIRARRERKSALAGHGDGIATAAGGPPAAD